MDNTFQDVLDQKIDESFEQLQGEKSRYKFAGSIEIAGFMVLMAVILSVVHFIFWGAGYSVYAKKQHDHVVSVLTELPGPQQQLVEDAIASDGYVSLLAYREYVDMANDHKLKNEGLR